jgi:hypothetical protein
MLRTALNCSTLVALFAVFSALPATELWGAQSAIDRIEKIELALTGPTYVPQESQDLANKFVDQILPNLLAKNEILAEQLGFGTTATTVSIDQMFAVMLIRRDDILSLIARTQTPFDLVNNSNNWLEDTGGRLVARRIVFLLKVHSSSHDVGDARSSITIEQSPDGSSWHIIQIGAPKLAQATAQAVRKYSKKNRNHFLLWIPDLNRHYLGTMEDRMVNLTVLFKDRLTEGEPGKDQIIDSTFLNKLKRLSDDLDLPKKLQEEDRAKLLNPDNNRPEERTRR